MVNAGKRHVRLLPDGWTVVTKDHKLSAQWEHTVLVTGDRLRGADARRRSARPVTRRSDAHIEWLRQHPAFRPRTPHYVRCTPHWTLQRTLPLTWKRALEGGGRAILKAGFVPARSRRPGWSDCARAAGRPPAPAPCGSDRGWMRIASGRWWPSAATAAANCIRFSDVDMSWYCWTPSRTPEGDADPLVPFPDRAVGCRARPWPQRAHCRAVSRGGQQRPHGQPRR